MIHTSVLILFILWYYCSIRTRLRPIHGIRNKGSRAFETEGIFFWVKHKNFFSKKLRSVIKALQSQKSDGESPIIWHFCTYRTCRHALDMIRRMQTKAYIYGMRWSALLRNKTWLKYGWIHKIQNKTLTSW